MYSNLLLPVDLFNHNNASALRETCQGIYHGTLLSSSGGTLLRATGLADATPTSTTASAAVVLMNVTSGMSVGRGSKESQDNMQAPGQEQGQGLVHGRAMACALRCLSCLRQKNPAGAVAAFHAALMPGVIINIDSDSGRNIGDNIDSGDEGRSCSSGK